MTTLALQPICHGCAQEFTGSRCAAFPDGIPTQIIDEGYDHRQPYPGDNGIMFVQREGREDRTEAWARSIQLHYGGEGPVA